MLLRYSIIISFILLQVLPVAGQVSRKIKLTPVSLGMDLPESYKQRTFIKGLAGVSNAGRLEQLEICRMPAPVNLGEAPL